MGTAETAAGGAFVRARARTDAGPLLAVAAPAAILAADLAAAAPALTNQDTWLALVSGREIAERGLPHADHLTLLAAGHGWVDQQWLAQLVLYGAAHAGGVGVGLALAAALLATVAAFALAALTAHERGASPLSIVLAILAAAVAAPWGFQLRTQSLALPLFSLTLWLLARDPRAERRSTFLVLPVLCLWANLHGSAVVGVALVVLYALRTRRWACLLAPATLLASPYLLAIPGYYRTMLVEPPFGRAIAEWHRTTPSPLTAAFFALLAATAVLAVRRRARLTVFDALALVLTAAVALDALRGIVWFGLAAVAFLPGLATRRPGRQRLEGRTAAIFTGLAAVAVLAAAAVTAFRPGAAYAEGPAAVAAAVASRPAAQVLANDDTADWLLWEVPSLSGRLAYDVRFELLTRDQLGTVARWRTLAPGWRRALAGRTLVVDDARHVDRLVSAGGWRRVLATPTLAVAERSVDG
ncbi:MAG TPA: hypothetical protein VFJ77_06290 [Gaiellaceae bacterium]|nr:hypothetical protein [Gaiellaceae bacterium]